MEYHGYEHTIDGVVLNVQRRSVYTNQNDY